MEQVFSSAFGMLAQAAAPQGGSPWNSLIIFIPLFAIMYFLMIRPQQKKQKEHEQMLTQIKAGDKVMTNGGMIAKVVRVADKRVFLEVADKVVVEMVTGAIANIIKDENDASLDKKP